MEEKKSTNTIKKNDRVISIHFKFYIYNNLINNTDGGEVKQIDIIFYNLIKEPRTDISNLLFCGFWDTVTHRIKDGKIKYGTSGCIMDSNIKNVSNEIYTDILKSLNINT